MPKVIAEDSNDDIARNLWRTARLIRPSHPARKRWDLLMFLFVIYNAICRRACFGCSNGSTL